jgi:hypothetical protein
MSGRFAYESATLSARQAAGELELSEFALLPPYIGLEPQRDTCHDASLIQISHEIGVFCDGRLVLELLGPFWDRVFRLEFASVTQVEFSSANLLNGFDIESIQVAERSDGLIACSISCKPFSGFVSFEATSAKVQRFLLDKTLERPGNGL